jgi:hypothetical protein
MFNIYTLRLASKLSQRELNINQQPLARSLSIIFGGERGSAKRLRVGWVAGWLGGSALIYVRFVHRKAIRSSFTAARTEFMSALVELIFAYDWL